MMKFWEDWKEKLKKFLKADVLAECRQQVDHENRVVLCVLNSSMVCLSFMLAFYILWRKQADYYHEHMCILYAALFLILLFVSFYSKRDSGIRLSVLIAVEYVAIGSFFAMNHIIFGGRESTTAYYLLVGLAFCFLVRPIQMYLMQAESPGPSVGKLVPKARQSAMILYGIYVVISILEVVFLMAGGMPLYDALVSTFATAGTGGFSVKNASIAGYDSPYAEYVISVFLLLFSINFNLYFFILLRNIKPIFKNEELRWFLGIVAASVIAVAVNIRNMYPTVEEIIRKALFQVASIISTAGFSTADFDRWPELSRSILVCLMLIGACAGSTGGGIKVSRLIILLKSARCEVSRMMHPRSVNRVKLEGKTIDDEVLHNTLIFFVMYMLIVAVSTLLVASFDECDFTTNLTAVIANVGPGLGKVGPMGNFSEFSALSKIVLTLDMLIGRLEIFPIIMVFTPETWKKV